MLEKVLNVLVVLAAFQTCLVVDDYFDLRAILAVLLALGLVDVNGVEHSLVDLKSKLLASLEQMVRIGIHGQLLEAKRGNQLDHQGHFLALLLLLAISHASGGTLTKLVFLAVQL